MSELRKQPTLSRASERSEVNCVSKNFKEMAKKALEEAKKRKKLKSVEKAPKEINGPAGPEPTRYGDWEKKGIVSDF